MVVQKPNGLNSNRRSQNINKICFSHQVFLPALGCGTCHLLPHFHTRHVPRARLADGIPAASFTSFFEIGFRFFLRSTLDRIRLPQCGASLSSSSPSAWLSSESVGFPFLFPINPTLHIDSGFSFGIPISLHIAKDEFMPA